MVISRDTGSVCWEIEAIKLPSKARTLWEVRSQKLESYILQYLDELSFALSLNQPKQNTETGLLDLH